MAAAPPASGLSKAEYLRRRYLEAGGAEADKKRRKKKKAGKEPSGGRMRIVDDDDMSWKSIPVEQEKDEEEGDDGDLPVVAEFIDERPDEVRWMEEFRTSNKWKLLGDQNEESQGSDLSVTAKSTNSSEATKQKKTKHQSPPRRGRHDSLDQSLPRRGSHDSTDQSPPRRGHQDMPDQSPPRRGRRHDSADQSPPRRGRWDTPDQSPPRRGRHDSADQSPPRRGRWDTPDQSPPRRGRHDSADRPLPRRGRRDTPDRSPPRRGCWDSSDLSPKRLHSGAGKNNSRTLGRGHQECFPDLPSAHQRWQATPDVLPTQMKTCSSDADLLLPRKQLSSRGAKQRNPRAPSPRKRQRHDSESGSDSPLLKKSARSSSDSDLSPPRSTHSAGGRQQKPSSDLSPPRRTRRRSSDSDLSPPRRGREAHQKGPQMLSGGKAGLVSAELLRREQQELRKQGGSGGGKHLEAESQQAETIFRDKSGRKRDLKQEWLEQRKKAEEKSERDEQYAKWGKGLAQSRQQQQNVEDAVKEMQKPLARYIDDQDLDKMLREQEREGDPMADFLRKKKVKERKDPKEKPKYSGPAPPLNRFNIWPGYRWDGVDRSNGFEQKRFARIASKKAVQELAYKWSVEDM
ncbi:BUD13 homolog isoform X2 [Elgaria multicarinata webbii]|uniref:BUD13 homolog isoform X2 n=1 Tax=Elgaria multicarinata webbii TaxID=159646 RepID=UPI002FCD3438